MELLVGMGTEGGLMGQLEPGDSAKSSPQGEEGPPSLEYIQAKDLFPPKELVKEEENLQVRRV